MALEHGLHLPDVLPVQGVMFPFRFRTTAHCALQESLRMGRRPVRTALNESQVRQKRKTSLKRH